MLDDFIDYFSGNSRKCNGSDKPLFPNKNISESNPCVMRNYPYSTYVPKAGTLPPVVLPSTVPDNKNTGVFPPVLLPSGDSTDPPLSDFEYDVFKTSDEKITESTKSTDNSTLKTIGIALGSFFLLGGVLLLGKKLLSTK